MQLSYFTLLLCFCCSHVLGDLTERPQNVAVTANIGATVILRCTAHTGLPFVRIMWSEFATEPGGRLLSDNRGIVPSHPHGSRYAIIGNENAHEYHLQISNVTLADGGRYQCQDTQAAPPSFYRGFAELIVFESEPQCRDYSSSGQVFEHREYTAECEVGYRGGLVPRMEWRGLEGSFYRNGTQPPNFVWSYMSFTPSRTYEGLFYYCYTFFTERVDGELDHATNAPAYEHFHNGPALIVVWTPTDISVDPLKPTYEVGDILTCHADSKPPSTYQWTNLRTTTDGPSGPTFLITPDLEGTTQIMRCRASTNISGDVYTSDLFHNTTILAPTTTTVPTTIITTTPPEDGPCNDITGRWQSTNPSALICIDVDSKGNIFTLIRNGTDLFFATGRGKTVSEDYKHVGFTCLWPTAGTGTAGFTGECHNCRGIEVLLMAGLSRNKFHSNQCGTSHGTSLTNLYVFYRSGPACLGMTVDEVRTNQPWILEKMGVKAKRIFNLKGEPTLQL